MFCDFGPIFEEWEADFGRTYVLGDDPAKHALSHALPAVWHAGHEFFHRHPDLTGEQLYARMVALAAEAGWEFGGTIAGHLVGKFPHEKMTGDDIESYIAPGTRRRCAASTGPASRATGSWRSTWLTGTGRSAVSPRNCSTSASQPCPDAGPDQQAGRIISGRVTCRRIFQNMP